MWYILCHKNVVYYKKTWYCSISKWKYQKNASLSIHLTHAYTTPLVIVEDIYFHVYEARIESVDQAFNFRIHIRVCPRVQIS
jgi:hypothetical protein